MAEWFRWLFGLDASPDWVSGGEWHLEFNSVPQGAWAALCLLAGIAAVFGVSYLYRKEGRRIGAAVRGTLGCLRLLVLLVVTLMLLEVVLVLNKKEYVPSVLLALFDTSESMGLQDPYTNEQIAAELVKQLGLSGDDSQTEPSRATALQELRKRTRLELAKIAFAGIADDLADERLLSFYGFANKLEPLDDRQGLEILQATGTLTNVGGGIRDALSAHRGQPLAGILLVTDGRSNAGDDPLKTAELAGKQGLPIHVLAVGTAEGPRNLKVVEDLDTSPVVFVHDPAEISVLFESTGLAGAVVTVVLEQRQGDGPWQQIGTSDVTLGEDAVLQRVSFEFTPQATGQLDFRARVENVGPELTTSDNTGTAAVRVVRQRIRVLLISGTPSNELQFLRNAMLRDTAVEFASWLQTAGEDYEHVGSRPIRRLPRMQKELDRFDVLILLDADMRKLGPTWPEMITKFVGDAGGGLIYVAGESYTHRLFNTAYGGGAAVGDNSWIKVLPVVRDPGLYQTAAVVSLSSRETWRFELTPQGRHDSIFRFAADPVRNTQILASLPGMYWHFPVTRAKPAATVLARHGDPRMRNSFGRHVLMATHLYGPGRTVFIGFDSTYRWRYLAEEYFDSFWARLVDRVGRSKLLGGRYPFTLATDKSVYRVGDRVTLTARFISSSDLSESTTALSGELEVAGDPAQELTLEPTPNAEGTFQASFVADRAGPYMVRVLTTAEAMGEASPHGESGPHGGSGPRAATLSFRVEPPRKERDNPTLNRPLLEDIARASGGRVFSLAEAGNIPAAFNVKQVERVLEFRDELWDAPIFFCSVVLLLTAEWILRKRCHMV